MVNKQDLFYNITLHKGENILKSEVTTNLTDQFQNPSSQNEVDNYILNSNLNNNSIIK